MNRPALWLTLTALALSAALAVAHQHLTRLAGVVNGLPAVPLNPRPIGLGVNVALADHPNPRAALRALHAFGWVRQVFAWAEIEPQPGVYQWEKWDALVAAVRAENKQLVAVLQLAPDWARSTAHPTAPPRRASDLGAFAHALAARYQADIDVYQVWDEPNIGAGWGDEPISAARYAGLLEAAYTAIHAADPTAQVLTAGLAPTLENNAHNQSELTFLAALYQVGAQPFFDAVAGKPYGFYTGPLDRQADPATLNFSRFILLRQVMERYGDHAKLLWGTQFGWNRLDSPWGKATPDQQAAYTVQAYERARTEWPWAGVFLLETYQPAAPAADPRWGFALTDPAGAPAPLWTALNAAAPRLVQGLPPGYHTARNAFATYAGAWQFSATSADIPEDYAAAQAEFVVHGAEAALRVRRANYRAHLYVWVDGQPAPLLPRDGRGAYLNLTSPTLQEDWAVIPVAAGLDPTRPHTLTVQPERGWGGQWALAGVVVGQRADFTSGWLWVGALAGLAGLSAWQTARAVSHSRWRARWRARLNNLRARLGTLGHAVLTAVMGGLVYWGAWLTWGEQASGLVRRWGDALPLWATALTAGVFYVAPSAWLALGALAGLAVLVYLRVDVALVFIAFSIPFYLFPRLLWERGFALVETFTWLAALALVIHLAAQARAGAWRWPRLTWLDGAQLALFGLAMLSLLVAEQRDPALREFRVVFAGGGLFYLLLRAVPLSEAMRWRVVDAFVLGGVAVALIGLWQFLSRDGLITAEGGAVRITSVYGSPNNLALYLGRVWPLALAVAWLGASRPRRLAYGLAALVMLAAFALTLSRGGLALGLPAALLVLMLTAWGRRAWWVAGVGAGLAALALPLLMHIPRFADAFDLTSGTGFFRVNLWLSAWRMWLDHPLLGVGLDNFLYAYRGVYILPEAWQEPNLSHPHNLVLDYLTRLGLAGLAAGVMAQAGFWRQAWQGWRRALPADHRALLAGVMASMAYLLAHGLVDHALFLVDLMYAFSLLLALVQMPAQTPPAG